MPKKVNKMEHKVSPALQLNSIFGPIFTNKIGNHFHSLTNRARRGDNNIFKLYSMYSIRLGYFTDFSKAASHTHSISISMIKKVCQNKKLARGIFL